jgi:hypothetical protein
MISASIRSVVRCCWWLVITGVTIAATAWVVRLHYVNTTHALESARVEMKALMADTVLGAVLGAVLPKATLPQAMALTIALAEAVASVLIANQCRHISRLIRRWRLSRQRHDGVQAQEAARRLLLAGLELVVMIGILIWGIRWDVALFTPRSPIRIDMFDDRAIRWATVGVLGYPSLTVVGSLMVDSCLQRLDEISATLTQLIDRRRP